MSCECTCFLPSLLALGTAATELCMELTFIATGDFAEVLLRLYGVPYMLGVRRAQAISDAQNSDQGGVRICTGEECDGLYCSLDSSNTLSHRRIERGQTDSRIRIYGQFDYTHRRQWERGIVLEADEE